MTVAFPCEGHSVIQNINESRGIYRDADKVELDQDFLEFTADVLRVQRDGGRLALAENPLTSRAWRKSPVFDLIGDGYMLIRRTSATGTRGRRARALS